MDLFSYLEELEVLKYLSSFPYWWLGNSNDVSGSRDNDRTNIIIKVSFPTRQVCIFSFHTMCYNSSNRLNNNVFWMMLK